MPRDERSAKLGSGVWASSLPILRGSSRRTLQDQAGCVDGVARCRSMDPEGPSSSLALGLAWPVLSSTARHGMDRVRGVTRSAELAGHIGTVGSRDGASIAHVAALYLIDRRRTV